MARDPALVRASRVLERAAAAVGRRMRRIAVPRTGPTTTADFEWRVTELAQFKSTTRVVGWCRTTIPLRIVRVATENDDTKALANVIARDDGSTYDFYATFVEHDIRVAREISLQFVLSDGSVVRAEDPCGPAVSDDAYHSLQAAFFERVRERAAREPLRVVEIGARNRSGAIRRELVAPASYVGVDIVDGENVDVVADAHCLSAAFPADSFDAAFSVSTFEHLAMPWKAVIELNHVLRTGAEVLVASHQTYPLHDEPWDFWRFSAGAWRSLFNPATGFEIVQVAYGEPANVVSQLSHGTTDEIEYKPAFLGSAVVARKIAPTSLQWDVPMDDVAPGNYPG